MAGVNRKTVTRWRQGVVGFAAAYDRAVQLSRDESERARRELELLVLAWTPGGLVTNAEQSVVDPDVLGADGSEITLQGALPSKPFVSPYTKVRPPTPDEWIAEMAAMAKDERQPERVRVTAIAAVTTGLLGGPGGRSRRPAELDDPAMAAAAQARGRDPGVPASVWQEARRNFLGPAPAQADDSKGGDVVELEQATPS